MLLLHLRAEEAAESLWDFLLAWELELPLLPLVGLGLLYAVGLRRMHHQHQAGPTRAAGQTCSADGRWYFLTAWLVLAVALLSPLHGFGEELFFIHMLQHVLLINVAAPFLLLANPLPQMLWGMPPRARAAVGRAVSQAGWAHRLLQQLTQPLVAWWIFVANLWLWHQPTVYQAALTNELLHYLQHLLFFGTAMVFWWPVIGPAPLRSRLRYPARMLYVFATWLPNSLLGAVITFAPSALLSYYAARPRHWGIDPLTDQQLAGLLMWLPGDLIYALAMLLLLLAALRQEDRRDAQASAAP